MKVSAEIADGLAFVTIDNPPVNAMSKAVRERLWTLVNEFDANPKVEAVILSGEGKLFMGGADISEFDRPLEPPFLPILIERIVQDASSRGPLSAGRAAQDVR